MRCLVDMALSPGLAVWLSQQGHDAVHAVSLGLDRAPDPVILERALRESWVIITADLDYPRLLALGHATSPGLILFRGGDYTDEEVVRLLSRVLATIPDEEIAASVVVIEKGRTRRRRLPILNPGSTP